MKIPRNREVPEDVRSTLARIERHEGEKEPYDWRSRIMMFVFFGAVVTAFFGYWFVGYAGGMGMSAGVGNSSDRQVLSLIVFGYPVVMVVVAFGLFKG
jgi:hypothetical protein